jgi:hypothetical protein
MSWQESGFGAEAELRARIDAIPGFSEMFGAADWLMACGITSVDDVARSSNDHWDYFCDRLPQIKKQKINKK